MDRLEQEYEGAMQAFKLGVKSIKMFPQSEEELTLTLIVKPIPRKFNTDIGHQKWDASKDRDMQGLCS